MARAAAGIAYNAMRSSERAVETIRENREEAMEIAFRTSEDPIAFYDLMSDSAGEVWMAKRNQPQWP